VAEEQVLSCLPSLLPEQGGKDKKAESAGKPASVGNRVTPGRDKHRPSSADAPE